MRVLSILSVLFITLISCNCQKKAVEATTETSVNAKEVNANMELIYTANTRGFYQKITVKNQEAFVSSDRNSAEKGESIKISDADWKELSGYINSLKLDQLATYKDPTQKRFYDGAAIANLKVISEEKEYQTVDFDNGFPPVEIEKLVNKITSLAKKE
ncbi:hypothetical protein [Flavobacterium sp.]|uniref:hypothetical protein n=1 Tax=Flavobacterium sp. TaxID=239 RepID=UPI0037508D19